MEVVVTTGAIGRAKLQLNHHHQQTNTQFFYRPDALPVAQPTVSTHWRKISHGLAYPKLTRGLPTLSLTTNSSWLPWGGLPCLSSALLCQYPCTAEKSRDSLFETGTPAQTGTGTLIVHLMDVNDNFPEFAENYRPVVYENRPPGQTVIRIIAEDRDTRSNGPPFEFWLPCGGGCPCPGNPSCADFSFKFIPGVCYSFSRQSSFFQVFPSVTCFCLSVCFAVECSVRGV